MNQMNTPEATLAKVTEFIKTGDEDNAILVIYDFMMNSKKKYWTHQHELLIHQFIELTIKRNKLKLLKEGLNYFRGISQNTNIDSFSGVLTKTKELVEDKFLKAFKTYQGVKVDIQDLEAEDSPELFLLSSFDDEGDVREKEDLINSQKFIWETYKILLDLTKTNSKLFSLYAQILKAAFTFCRENRRTVEFKRLCDSVRGYLQTLIKSEKRQNFMNKVQISKLEVLRILIQMRLNQLDTATELEQWLEAFKTAEDIIYLMGKYEKHSEEQDKKEVISKRTLNLGEKPKKSAKLNPMLKLEFYSNIEKLLWISDYPLYHAYSTIIVKEIGQKVKHGLGEKLKDMKPKLERFDLDSIDSRLILATLATPLKNSYTNYIRIGDELFEGEREVETETCSRMMTVLKLNCVPSRKNLITFIENNKILNFCEEKITSLYKLFENETNPLYIMKNCTEIISYIKSVPSYAKYSPFIVKNLITRCLILMSKMYDSISVKRLMTIFSCYNIREEELENIISENSRIGLLNCTIDHSSALIRFKSRTQIKENLQEKLKDFTNKIQTLSGQIIQSNPKNEKKFLMIKEAIYNELNSNHSNSLAIYENILKEIKTKNALLKEFSNKKAFVQAELREKITKEKEDQRKRAVEEAKLMQELMRDEQKKKEYDIQVKKYVIELIRKYTNAIIIDGKKVKLDDLLKDLNKVSEEVIIKQLEDQENDFKLKKEKKFKQISIDVDYITREFRRRDNEVYKNQTQKEEAEFNSTQETLQEQLYSDKIGMKKNLIEMKPFKDKYFNACLEQNVKAYEIKLVSFKENLETKIREDFYKELSAHFKSYFDDYKKRESEKPVTKTREDWGRSMKYDNKDRGSTRSNQQFGWNRGGLLTEEPKKTETSDFQRGKNIENVKPKEKQPEIKFERSSEFIKEQKEATAKVDTPTAIIASSGFAKGIKASEASDKDTPIITTKSSDSTIPTITSSSSAEIKRGGSEVKKDTETKGADIKRPKLTEEKPKTEKDTSTGWSRGQAVQQTTATEKKVDDKEKKTTSIATEKKTTAVATEKKTDEKDKKTTAVATEKKTDDKPKLTEEKPKTEKDTSAGWSRGQAVQQTTATEKKVDDKEKKTTSIATEKKTTAVATEKKTDEKDKKTTAVATEKKTDEKDKKTAAVATEKKTEDKDKKTTAVAKEKKTEDKDKKTTAVATEKKTEDKDKKTTAVATEKKTEDKDQNAAGSEGKWKRGNK